MSSTDLEAMGWNREGKCSSRGPLHLPGTRALCGEGLGSLPHTWLARGVTGAALLPIAGRCGGVQAYMTWVSIPGLGIPRILLEQMSCHQMAPRLEESGSPSMAWPLCPSSSAPGTRLALTLWVLGLPSLALAAESLHASSSRKPSRPSCRPLSPCDPCALWCV